MSSDPCSKCNFTEVVLKHIHWVFETDFKNKKFLCSATLEATTLQDGCSKMVLDTCELAVASVVNADNGESLSFEEQRPEGAFGSTLVINLPTSCSKKGAEVKVIITYETSPSCSAVQWLEPQQTAGKEHPYVFTQCQPIHARSLLPCQDTPSVKTTFTAEVTVPSELIALMGAERLGSVAHEKDTSKTVFKFHQKVPIPSYLISLVVGALESRQVGPRSHVWCEKEKIEQAAWEFSETDRVLSIAEGIAGPYVWGNYDLLILPPSFAYGGMENPCLTFVSPTVMSTTMTGKKEQAILIVAHEASHSWTGNLVTNMTWEDFWLNEGITTFLERLIIGRLGGEKARHLDYINGWKNLRDAIKKFESDNKPELTAMVPKLTGVHPDDAYSTIPYEKGAIFFFYLETLLGGPGSLDGFLKSYVEAYKYKNLTTLEWKEFFLNFFEQEVKQGVFADVEWDKWFYQPGLPPYTPKFDTSLADASAALAQRWASLTEFSDASLTQFPLSEFDDMPATASQVVLNNLLEKPDPLCVEALQAMEKIYSMSKRDNSEIRSKWLRLCLKAKWNEVFPLVVSFITSQGRMKYIRPLYQGLYECGEEGKKLALLTFTENKSFYSCVAAAQLEKDLKLK